MDAKCQLLLKGCVKQYELLTHKPILEQDNLVVDAAYEVILGALFNQQHLSGIAYGFTGGRPVTPGLRTLSGLLGIATLDATPSTRSFLSKDSRGQRTIGFVSAIITPDGSLTYDTLGLISNINLLYAATTFTSRTITAPVVTEWTLYL